MDLLVTSFYDLFCKQNSADNAEKSKQIKFGSLSLSVDPRVSMPRYPGSQCVPAGLLMMQNNLKLNSCSYNYTLTAACVSPHK